MAIDDMIKTIRKRPGMFLGSNSITALWHFLDGYQAAERDLGVCWKAVLSEENIHWNNSMEHGALMGNNKKELMFTDPVAVYVIELTISAYILAVETSNHIKLGPQFFQSLENAKSGTIPFSAQIYFGKVDSWEEIKSSNIDFGENIIF